MPLTGAKQYEKAKEPKLLPSRVIDHMAQAKP